MRFLPVVLLACLALLFSCKKNVKADERARLTMKFRFDSTQVRLNNVGQPTNLVVGNAAQSPVMNGVSAHYVELAPSAFTAIGNGIVLSRAAETGSGSSLAIDFGQAQIAPDGGAFVSVPLTDIPPGEYEFLRVSLSYQNFDVKYLLDTVVAATPIRQEFFGTVAGFLGFNNFIRTVRVKDRTLNVNGTRPQGFWAFESNIRFNGLTFPVLDSATAPAGATTVVNPIFSTSPVPEGSCIITGAFVPGKLVIRGNETRHIEVEVSLSTNKSFEWNDLVPDGRWEPLRGERVQDMGIRGMIPRLR